MRVIINQPFVLPMFGSSNIASGRKKIFGIVKKLLNLFGKISRKGILNSKKIMIAKKKK